VTQQLRIFFLILVGLGLVALVDAQAANRPVDGTARVKLGQSVVALNGPWKFQAADSPLDPRTGGPLWAEPGFDDSKWETVDLTSGAGELDPINGMSGYAPGWTMRGHPGYWGFAWYRIRVQLDSLPGEELALSGPADVDDVYQAFANGSLLGSFGNFSSTPPAAYYAQPKMFLLPQLSGGGNDGERNAVSPASSSDNRITAVIAFRVWMEPNSLVSQPDAGGFHTAPVLGEVGAVTAGYQLRWLELVRAYAVRIVEGLVYGVLTLVVCSLMLFDRSDRVYLWISAVFLGLTMINILVGIGAWTQYVITSCRRPFRMYF
jgi:hypothetical protein